MHGRKIGLYGGSFNPIHVGHIALAREIMQKYGLDEVWFVVSPHNPLKDESCLATDEERFILTKKALSGEHGLMASDYEFHLPRPSYMWNTLTSLTEDFPDDEFSLIIGADNWQCFPRWYNYREILASYHIIIYPREGYATDNLPSSVTLADTRLWNVSSTMIRDMIHRGESIKGLVADDILDDVVRLYAL